MILIHATIWSDPENTMQVKEARHKGHILDDLGMRNVQNRQIRDREQIMAARAEENRGMESDANGYTVSFPGDENSQKSDSGVGCTTLWICLKILNYTLERGEFYGVRITPQ